VNLFDQLRRDEGDKGSIYYVNGIPHVGIGHNLVSGPPLSHDLTLAIAKADTSMIVDSLSSHIIGWNRLSDCRQAVLIGLAFQCGVSGLYGFVRMLQAIALEDWGAAAAEIRRSELAHENVDRTERLARQMESDTWV
jgi:lysozyme